MHGFILMCDLTNDKTVKAIPDWIKQIEERANIIDHAVLVLGNKCDRPHHINQNISSAVESALMYSHPDVLYREISVNLDIEIDRSLADLGGLLVRNKQSYID